MRYTLFALPIVLIAACASQKVTPQVAASGYASNHAVAAAAATGAGSATPGAPAPGATTAKTGTVNVDLLRQGYHTGTHRGQLVYCRTEQLTGSRFKSDVCMTEAQVLEQQQKTRDQMNQQQRSHCLGPECN